MNKHNKIYAIDYLKSWLELNNINRDDCVVRFGLARVIHYSKDEYVRDIDLYLKSNAFNFLKLKGYKSIPVAASGEFPETEKIIIEIDDNPMIEIFLIKTVYNIDKFLYNDVYVVTKPQLDLDYKLLGRKMYKDLLS